MKIFSYLNNSKAQNRTAAKIERKKKRQTGSINQM